MDPLADVCSSKDSEGLILSSFGVLENSSTENHDGSVLDKGHDLNYQYGDDEHLYRASMSTTSTNSSIDGCGIHNHQQPSCDEDDDDDNDDDNEEEDEAICRNGNVDEDSKGPDHYHNDDAFNGLGDAHDYRTNDVINDYCNQNTCMQDEEDNEDEEEEEDEDEEDTVEHSTDNHALEPPNFLQDPQLQQHSGTDEHCSEPPLCDLRAGQQYLQYPSGTILAQNDGWHSSTNFSESTQTFPANWRITIPHTGHGLQHPAIPTVTALHHMLPNARGEIIHTERPQRCVAHHQDLWNADSTNGNDLLQGQTWMGNEENLNRNGVDGDGDDDDDDEEDEEPEEDEDEDAETCARHNLEKMHHHNHQKNGEIGNWSSTTYHGELHNVWQKEMSIYSGPQSMGNTHGMFTAHNSQGPIPAQVSADIVSSGQSMPWLLRGQLPPTEHIDAIPRQYVGSNTLCSQQPQHHRLPRFAGPHKSSSFFRPSPSSQRCTQTLHGHNPWPQTQAMHMQSTPHLESKGREHFKNLCSQPVQGLRYQSKIQMISANDLQRDQSMQDTHHSKIKSVLTQARQQSHPYQPKEDRPIAKDMYHSASTSVHTLKASHIVSWYIDYLIHENEHLTQISRAFSLPVNLFHSDDFYFMDSLKKKVHFPSLKFLTWMQHTLPAINLNTVDFRGGKQSQESSAQSSSATKFINHGTAVESNHSNSSTAACSSTSSMRWSLQHHQLKHQHQRHHHLHQHHTLLHKQQQQQQQQQELAFLQNKSRRDIIHDVFFYFQHRRVTCQN